MSEPAFGANVTRLFDPAKDTHYAVSEDAQFELRQLFAALEAVAQVMDTPPGHDAPEIQPDHIAPIFASFARHGQRIMVEMPTQFPHRRTGRTK